MTEIISGLKQDKEMLQKELGKKADVICDFLQDKMRPGRVWFGNPAVQRQLDRLLTLLHEITFVRASYLPWKI